MRKLVGMFVLGIGGLAAAIGLTVGALALAGDDVGAVVQPALAPSRTHERSSTATPSPSAREDREDRGTPTATPSVDDHGGDWPGSDDGSGSGSNSGPGSSNSGSGSSGSGSGSDDD